MINKSLEETVAAHCSTAVAAIVISSVGIHGIANPPCWIGSAAISFGIHGRERFPSRVPHTSLLSSREDA